VDENAMMWPHIIDDLSNKNSKAADYKVDLFPQKTAVFLTLKVAIKLSILCTQD
jgi:hypothetical protein